MSPAPLWHDRHHRRVWLSPLRRSFGVCSRRPSPELIENRGTAVFVQRVGDSARSTTASRSCCWPFFAWSRRLRRHRRGEGKLYFVTKFYCVPASTPVACQTILNQIIQPSLGPATNRVRFELAGITNSAGRLRRSCLAYPPTPSRALAVVAARLECARCDASVRLVRGELVDHNGGRGIGGVRCALLSIDFSGLGRWGVWTLWDSRGLREWSPRGAVCLRGGLSVCGTGIWGMS